MKKNRLTIETFESRSVDKKKLPCLRKYPSTSKNSGFTVFKESKVSLLKQKPMPP